jgi:HlyD family secretion protein
MTHTDDSTLPLDLHRRDPLPKRRIFRKRFLLVLLVPVLMFSGAVMGMYFQPPGLQRFYALTGLQPGGGSESPIALPPEIEMPPKMAETLLPSDVVGLARIMPQGDVAVVAAPYGAGDARVAEILVAIGDTVARGDTLARLDNAQALEGAVLQAEANLAVRQAALMQTRSAIEASRAEAQASLDQARAAAQAVARAEATLARFAAGPSTTSPMSSSPRRNVAAAEAELTRARMDLGRAEVRAPIAARSSTSTRPPGNARPPRASWRWAIPAQMMAEVEVWQDRIASVAVGQPVELAAPMRLGGRCAARRSIGLTVGRQGLISDDAAANSDARVVRVLVALDAESSAIAARYVNLEAVARGSTPARGARAAQ